MGKIFGTIRDASTKEPLQGASVQLFDKSQDYKKLGVGIKTGKDGSFSLTSPYLDDTQNKIKVIFSYVGYEDYEASVWTFGDILLQPSVDVAGGKGNLEEVIVTNIKKLAVPVESKFKKYFPYILAGVAVAGVIAVIVLNKKR
jgi:uncharacterized membrane protein YraQ (UPF0718 family)